MSKQTTAGVVAGKKLWKLCGDKSFAWSDLCDEERDHWVGMAQQVVAAYQRARRELAPMIHVNRESLTDAE